MVLKRDIGVRHGSISTVSPRWKTGIKVAPQPLEERHIVAHAPKLLIIGYVHALLSSRATFLIMPVGSHIWHRKLSKAH
ncbi:hypothetical protein WK26_04890 [Burkholderia vietnamiensis]|nr:hypothetical protein WK26_04890 [Burkholderia vietnamiensis]